VVDEESIAYKIKMKREKGKKEYKIPALVK